MSIELLPEQPGHIVRFGSQLSPKIRENVVELPRENVDLITWKPEDMKGINPEVAVHRLNIKPGTKLVKQKR